MAALAGEGEGDLAADPAAAAGHHRHLAREPQVHCSPSSLRLGPRRGLQAARLELGAIPLDRPRQPLVEGDPGVQPSSSSLSSLRATRTCSMGRSGTAPNGGSRPGASRRRAARPTSAPAPACPSRGPPAGPRARGPRRPAAAPPPRRRRRSSPPAACRSRAAARRPQQRDDDVRHDLAQVALLGAVDHEQAGRTTGVPHSWWNMRP